MTSEKNIVLVSILLIGLVTGVTMPMAAAQDNETASDQEDSASNQSTTSMMIDEDVAVADYRYSSESETLEIDLENRGDGRATIMLVEVIESGAESFSFERVRLRGGDSTTVLLEGIADQGGDPAVMVATETSLEDQSVEWIPTGETDTTVVTLGQGVLIGLVTMTFVTAGMAWRRYNKPGEAPEDGLKDDKGWF